MAGPAAASFSPPPQQGPSVAQRNADILSAFNTSQPISQTTTPTPSLPQQLPQQPITATPPPPPADPFASLVSGSSRGPSPLVSAAAQSQPSQPPAPAPASSSLLDLAGGPVASTGKGPEDDEWDFTSSLPQASSLPSTNKVQVLSSSLRVEFVARRNPNQAQQIHIVALFSNTTGQGLTDLHFQVAVEKVNWELKSTITCTDANRDQNRHTACSSGPKPVEKLPGCSKMACNRRCYWTGLKAARGTRSRFGSKYRTESGRRRKRNRGWCHLLGFCKTQYQCFLAQGLR